MIEKVKEFWQKLPKGGKVAAIIVLVLILGQMGSCINANREPAPSSTPKQEKTTVADYSSLDVGETAKFDDYEVTVQDTVSDGKTLTATIIVSPTDDARLSLPDFSAKGVDNKAIKVESASFEDGEKVKAGSSFAGSIVFPENEIKSITWVNGKSTATWSFSPTLSKVGEPEPVSGTLMVHYIDAGQGDSEFIELPNGKTMLIDAGTAASGQQVASYISGLGYSKIDYLVASHPHDDHIGGLPAVITQFDIGEVWAPKVSHTTSSYEALLDAVAVKNLSIHTAEKGKQILSTQGCSVDILSPEKTASYDDLNDWSVIQTITFGDKVFLLTGDASSKVISANMPKHVDALKIGHHGSKTSTTASLISALSPEVAVISCGVDNQYGHPHDETLSALANITTYRTDINGTIVATCDGKTIDWQVGRTEAPAEVSEPDHEPEPAPEVAPTPAPSQEQSGGGEVYITNSGAKYHSDGCSSLSKSKIPISRDKAQAQGYEPCKRCNP